MNLIGLIMAGGKGKRMEVDGEKPLLSLANKPMIKHVIDTLTEVEEIGKIIVATSPNTPKTTRYVTDLSLETIETKGKGYHHDLKEALKKIINQTTLIISSDLPLVKPATLKKIIEKYRKTSKPSLSVFIDPNSLELDRSFENEFELEGKTVYPAGINIIKSQKINQDKIEQKNILLSETEIALNVNNEESLELAEKKLQKRREKT